MGTGTVGTTRAPIDETARAYRAAAEAHDAEALIALLAPDAVLHSPISGRAHFHGHAQLDPLFRAVFAVMSGVRLLEAVGEGDMRAFVFAARAGGRDLEETAIVRFDEQARIRELTIFIRPLTGLAALAAALAPRLAADSGRGRLRAGVLTAMLKPLAAMTAFGDGPAVRLLKGSR